MSKKPIRAHSTDRKFPREGLVRLKQILAPNGPIPVCASTWWAGVNDGRFPKPTEKKLSTHITTWRAEDILALIESNDEADDSEKD